MLAPATPIVLNVRLKTQLERLTRDGGTSQRVVARCRVILLAHQGETNVAIAKHLGLSRPTVLATRSAFAKEGLKALTGIRKRKRSARVLTPELEQRILDATLLPIQSCSNQSVPRTGEVARLDTSDSTYSRWCRDVQRGHVEVRVVEQVRETDLDAEKHPFPQRK